MFSYVSSTNFLYDNNETNLVMHLFLELDKLIDRIFNIFEKTWLYWWYEYQILELCLVSLMSYANNNVMSLLILPITNKKRWPLDLQLFFHCASFMTFLYFSCETLTYLKKKKLQNLVHIVFSILQCTGILFAFENVSNIYQFGGHMVFLVIKIEN